MDPNQNLIQQRQFAEFLRRASEHGERNLDTDDAALRLANLSVALDEWLCSGGFLPEDWQAGPITIQRKVKGDRPDFKNVTVSMAQYGAYVEVWWHRGAPAPSLEANFFDGSEMTVHKAATLATLLKIGSGIAKGWADNPPWERSIA